MDTMKKRAGETKVVLVAGDHWHNGQAQEFYVRSILKPEANWRIIAVRGSEFFTPELISDADLLITSKASGTGFMGYSRNGLVDEFEEDVPFWTDRNADVIMENVSKRGMGWLALHCSVYCRVKRLTDFMDVEPVMHNEVQPLWVYDCNREHPVTSGIENFMVDLDEQFAVILKSADSTPLFYTQAMHDKRTAMGGWCLERGKGRIIGLLPGHTPSPYRTGEYADLFWRAAHWAAGQEVKARKG